MVERLPRPAEAYSPWQGPLLQHARRFQVTPEILQGDDRTTGWECIVAEAPQFAGHLETTDRELPIVRLTRES